MKSKQLIHLFLVLLLLNSCSHKIEAPKVGIIEPKKTNEFDLPPFFNSGKNEQPYFSPANQKILYVSSQRKFHKNPQIYEFTFKNKLDRRVTFQDGNAQNPIYFENNWIVYDSTTDEIKEAILEKNQIGSEIYLSDSYGENIYRLTDRKGPDHSPVVSDKNSSIFYFQDEEKNRSIIQLKFNQFPENFKKINFYSDKKHFPQSMAVSQDDSWLYWIEQNSAQFTSSLYRQNLNQKKLELVVSFKGLLSDIHKLSSESYFLGVYKNKPNTMDKIIIFDSTQLCAISILENKNHITKPIYINASIASVLYTLEKANDKNIFQFLLKNDLGSCEPIEKAQQ